MFTGSVGPVEICIYWPKAVFFLFLFLHLASHLLLVSSPEGCLSGCRCIFRPEVSAGGGAALGWAAGEHAGGEGAGDGEAGPGRPRGGVAENGKERKWQVSTKPSNAEATFVLSTRMRNILETF